MPQPLRDIRCAGAALMAPQLGELDSEKKMSAPQPGIAWIGVCFTGNGRPRRTKRCLAPVPEANKVT
jgi:hypothetical protein